MICGLTASVCWFIVAAFRVPPWRWADVEGRGWTILWTTAAAFALAGAVAAIVTFVKGRDRRGRWRKVDPDDLHIDISL